MFDTIIRDGAIIDGTGVSRRVGDIAIQDGVIAAIGGRIEADAAAIVDAAGMIVAPGFVDVHTHYDGQATWDDQLLPSSAHGVTTIVMGSCGIGFAPVRKGAEDWLIALTEGVEDIPGAVLSEGIRWSWESFPEYLDYLDTRNYALDVAAHFPHSALRAYVMGERTIDNRKATAEDLQQMAELTRAAISAGALGVGTSRLMTQHFSSDGSPLPGTNAAEEELLTLAEAMRDSGGGVLQIAPFVGGDTSSISTMGAGSENTRSLRDELMMMRRVSKRSGQPITFSFAESLGAEAVFQDALNILEEALANGERLAPQFSAKPIGALSTLDGYHAFSAKPSYQAMAHLPLEQRVQKMRDPAMKAKLLAEADGPPAKFLLMNNFPAMLRGSAPYLYIYDENFDYEPEASKSIAALAAAEGRDPLEFLYDVMLRDDGRSIVVAIATNFSAGDLRLTEEMLRRDNVLVGLGDAGAHVRAIIDGSQPTFSLIHWGRDRRRGATVMLETLIKKQTADAAAFYGLNDRGILAPGYRADLNVIDIEKLSLGRPYLCADLPAGSMRFLQDAEGYAMTMVAGVATRRNDSDTGARPGRLVRGRQSLGRE